MSPIGRAVILGLMLTGAAAESTGVSGVSERYAPVTVPVSVKQVSPHCYYVEGAAGAATDNEGFISNAGFVVTGDGVVVFDTLGSPSLAQALVDEIRKVTPQPIVKVVVSHYHADHIYGLQVFQDLGAEILAPRGASDYLESEGAQNRLEERRVSLAPWVTDDTRLVYPDVIVETSSEFRLGEVTFALSYLGAAHSDGDLALFVEPDRVLFSGDIIFEGRIPFVGDADTRHWLRTLDRMHDRGLVALVPGHGPVSDDPSRMISLTREYLSYLRRSMGGAVEEFIPFDEAYSATDWSRYRALPAFEAANRVNAYQVYLSLEAEALSDP